VRASGSAGGRAADPERAAPATAAPAAKARRKADKRRAAAGDVAGSSAYESGLPSEGRPGKRHRAAAAGSPGGVEAGVARAALGAAEAEARFAGEAANEDDNVGDERGALRRLGVRNADPRFAAALAHERAGFAQQARSSRMCAVVGCSAAACSRTVRCKVRCRQRVRLLHTATHLCGMGRVVASLADTTSVPHSVSRLVDRAFLPRCTERAPMRALRHALRRAPRRRRQPSSAWPRRWRIGARSLPSRRAACCACAAVGCTCLSTVEQAKDRSRIAVDAMHVTAWGMWW
jgi:hypothetical protein